MIIEDKGDGVSFALGTFDTYEKAVERVKMLKVMRRENPLIIVKRVD